MICFVILSHREPGQVIRLVRRLADDAGSAVLVHHDQSATPLERSELRGAGRVELVRFRRGIRWGTWDLVDVTLRCLRWAYDRVPFDWLVLLSGQDYPLVSPPQIEAFFAGVPVDAYTYGVPVQPRPVTGWRPSVEGSSTRRYFYRYHVVPRLRVGTTGRTGQALRLAGMVITAAQPWVVFEPFPDGRLHIGFRRVRTPFSEDYICYKGSQWFAASRQAVAALLQQISTGALVDYYRRCLIPDESFVQTALLNTPSLTVSNTDLWFTRWQPNAYHPDILTAADVDDALASGKLFARKFDVALDAEALDRIDRRLGTSSIADVGPGPGIRRS
jgi:hypothetical protein